MPPQEPPSSTPATARSVLREITQPFIDLVHAPRALWGVNVSYLLEGLTYFGVLTLLALFFNTYIGLNDINAGQMVGVLTGGITIAMTLFGATVDIIGVRKALLASLALMLVGRVLLTLSPAFGGPAGLWSAPHLVAMFGILWVVAGYGIYQPACYAAVKQFTTEKTAAMGYAMLYALMNLGGFLPAIISPPVREAYGMTGVFWVYVALTVAGIAVVTMLITRRSVQAVLAATGGERSAAGDSAERKSMKESILYYLKNFPIRDYRFMFFIFILIPVQTLFAHNWLTLPQYFSRAFSGVVSERFETFANINSLLIFVLTPMVAALSSRRDAYSMMIVGTFVMGAPAFLLAIGPNIVTVFGYLIIMTIGEAIWSPRFLQWVAEIAPKGMTGIYMGIGQFPWFLTKIVTSLYSGWFLMHYCPEGVPPSEMHTETMWLIYGCIAILTPVGLIAAKGWMKKGFKTRAGA